MSGRPIGITAQLLFPRLIRDNFAHGAIHPWGFTGSAWPSATSSRAGGSFPASPWERGSPGARAAGTVGDRALWRHAQPRAIGPGISSRAFRGGIYLRQICKLEHVIFPLSSPGEGLWPEWSRQIFGLGAGSLVAPCSQLTPRGSLASAGHGQIKDAVFAAGIGPRQPLASHGELGISSPREESFDVGMEGTDGRWVSLRFPSPLHQRPNFGAGPLLAARRPGFLHQHPCFSAKPQLSSSSR